MKKTPEHDVVEEVRKTHNALEKLPREDRNTILSRAIGSIAAIFAQKRDPPETGEVLAEKYFQEHPELVKPLEKLEKIIEAKK